VPVTTSSSNLGNLGYVIVAFRVKAPVIFHQDLSGQDHDIETVGAPVLGCLILHMKCIDVNNAAVFAIVDLSPNFGP
jgi:hypothetical protein